MPLLEVTNLDKTFVVGQESVSAIDKLNLSIEEHEFVSLVGPSGCGKSTFLHIVGGLSALMYVDVQALRLRLGPGKRTAVDVSALFWHFVDGLWLYLMVLFLVWG